MSFMDRVKNAIALVKTKPGSEEEKAFGYPKFNEIKEIEKPKFLYPRGTKDLDWFLSDEGDAEYSNAKSLVEKSDFLYSLFASFCVDITFAHDTYFKLATIIADCYSDFSLKELLDKEKCILHAALVFFHSETAKKFIDDSDLGNEYLAYALMNIDSLIEELHKLDGSKIDIEELSGSTPCYDSIGFSFDADGKLNELQMLLIMLKDDVMDTYMVLNEI